MNCNQANQIPMEKVLKSFSLFPSKASKRGAFYFAVERKESTPSLHLNFKTNRAHDFGSGKTYDNVSLVQAIKGCSVSEALVYLSKLSFFFPKQDNSIKRIAVKKKKTEPDWKIRKMKPVEHPALISYLESRKVIRQKNELREIHYTVDKKFYFGIGFENDSRGWEIRNKYAKLCLGKKAITTIKNGSLTLRIFEGFFDYLSFLEIREFLEFEESDYLILNSISLVNRLKGKLSEYEKIELYLDNDDAGNQATNLMKSFSIKAKDNRMFYRRFKDLNDYLLSSHKTNKRE